MSLWKIITLTCAATILVEARWNHQKRSAFFDICEPVYNNTNKIQCYCKRNPDKKLIKSAVCYLTSEGVEENDAIWNEFKTIEKADALTLSNEKGITLSYIPSNTLKLIDALLKLDIKYANIEIIKAFAFANSSTLQDINLTGNQIVTLEPNAFAHHKDLIILNLDSNNINEINRNVFVDLPHIDKLYLTSNKITTIHDRAFLHLTNLKELELYRNNIFSLNSEIFSGLKSLERLDISGNNLEVIGDNTFLPLVNLKTLNLDNNKIQMLDDKAFNGLRQLQTLSLAHNKLTDLDSVKIFENMDSLILLSLKANQIHQLKLEVFAPILANFYGNTSSLDIDDNNVTCSCQLDWFLAIMNKTQNTYFKLAIENLKCLPDEKLKEEWTKTKDTDYKAPANNIEESQLPGNDYDYYDETQLNGNLFYTDVRDLLNCSNPTNNGENNTKITVTPKPTFKSTQTTKAIYSTTTIKTTTTQATTVKTTTKDTTVKTTTHDPEQQKPTTNKIKESEATTVSTKKAEPFTTTRLATVSDNPIKNNIYHDMASDEAKPDNIKADRSIQVENETQNQKGNDAFTNVGCITLMICLLHIKLIIN